MDPINVKKSIGQTPSAKGMVRGAGFDGRAETGLALDLCCLINFRILVLLGRFDFESNDFSTFEVKFDSFAFDELKRLKLEAVGQTFSASNASPSNGGMERTFSLVMPLLAPPELSTEIIVEATSESRRFQSRLKLTTDLDARTLLFAGLAILHQDTALCLLERISEVMGDHTTDRALASWLRVARAYSVRRLPTEIEIASPDVRLHCDNFLLIGEHGVFVSGWLAVEPHVITRVTFHAAFYDLAIDDGWARVSRLDVNHYLSTLGVAVSDADRGFVRYFDFPNARPPFYISVTMTDGLSCRMQVSAEPAQVVMPMIHRLLTSFGAPHRALRALLERQIGPAVQTLWAARRESLATIDSYQFGGEIHHPLVSVIVPLHGRYDLAEYQVALFADDPQFQSLELIYFVDDPSIYDNFKAQCSDLYQTYRVPFTIAFAGANFGYAGANNLAVSIARARHLVFLNSDVMPKTPGWVAKMLALYGALESPGLLGVKLLYEDGSIQHAGMRFRRHSLWSDLWINDHPYKGQSSIGFVGLHRVPAVTTACAMIDADLFRCLGGFSENYIIGDFEDSDLCLRASAVGRANWVSLDIELYHLERQSMDRIGDALFRTNLTLYNCWQHNLRWGAHIETLEQ